MDVAGGTGVMTPTGSEHFLSIETLGAKIPAERNRSEPTLVNYESATLLQNSPYHYQHA
jgi:hypothetical protein